MERVDRSFPKRSKWSDVEENLLHYFRLPNGSRFRLRRTDSASTTKSRFARDDTHVRRRSFRRSEHPRDDTQRVKDVVAGIQSMLAPGTPFSVLAIAPDGQPLHGSTLLGTWRERPARATAEERDAAAIRREEIARVAKLASYAIAELEEYILDPEEIVPRAVISALLDRYGLGAIKEAIDELRIR